MAFSSCAPYARLHVRENATSTSQDFASSDALARGIAWAVARFDGDVRFWDPRQRWALEFIESGRVLRVRTFVESDTVWRVAQTIEIQAFGRSGRPTGMEALLARGRILLQSEREARRRARRHKHAYSGQGPVPGLANSRSRGQWRRRIHTRTELRLNALVVLDDGEVSARAARCGMNLPDTRHGHAREPQRSWKSQGKRRKAWERS